MELKYHHSVVVAAGVPFIILHKTLNSLISVAMICLTLSVYFLQDYLLINCVEWQNE